MKKVVLSLFDYTGNMLKPWRDAGYTCLAVDIQHSPDITERDGIFYCGIDLRNPEILMHNAEELAMVFAFPPCDHLAVSGARWFKGKGLRMLAASIELFASAVEVCEWSGAPYMIENPVSTISTYWRKPDFTFHPYMFTGHCAADNYMKKTCLWTGNGFRKPEPYFDNTLPAPKKLHIRDISPGPDRKNIRSATPEGFAKAVFLANTVED